jgi:hypothetical protein
MKLLYTLLFTNLLAVSAVGQSGLLAHFKFDGNTADSSGLGNHATANGAKLCPDRYGFPNKAIRLSASTDRISTPNSTTLSTNAYNEFTFSMWIKRRGFNYSNYNPMLFFLGQNTSNYALFIDPEFVGGLATPQYRDQLLFVNYSSTATYSSIFENTKISDTLWHQVTYVVNQNQGKLNVYFDGAQVGTDTYTPRLLSNSSLYIGSHPTQNWAFLGDIDDVRLYNRALTPQEIQGLVDAEEPEEKLDVSITPTLSTGLFEIASANQVDAKIQLFDLSGRQVLQADGSLPRTVNIHHLPNGMYTVVISSKGKRVVSQKVVLHK